VFGVPPPPPLLGGGGEGCCFCFVVLCFPPVFPLWGFLVVGSVGGGVVGGGGGGGRGCGFLVWGGGGGERIGVWGVGGGGFGFVFVVFWSFCEGEGGVWLGGGFGVVGGGGGGGGFGGLCFLGVIKEPVYSKEGGKKGRDQVFWPMGGEKNPLRMKKKNDPLLGAYRLNEDLESSDLENFRPEEKRAARQEEPESQ